jgi:hypothetical protein
VFLSLQSTEKSNPRLRKLINVVAFQAAWFAAVLGAAHHMPWLSVIVVPLALALHLALAPDWRSELLLALGAALTGFVFDTVLISADIFSPVPFLFPPPLSPLWMVLLWVNFATTFNVSLRFLQGRYALLAILGAVGGPMAYYSGARLGAMTKIPSTVHLVILAVTWAAAVPFLFLLSAKIERRLKR